MCNFEFIHKICCSKLNQKTVTYFLFGLIWKEYDIEDHDSFRDVFQWQFKNIIYFWVLKNAQISDLRGRFNYKKGCKCYINDNILIFSRTIK